MLLSYLLFVLLASFFDCVPGDIVVRQIDADIPTESWIVKGIASYEHSGANPKLFIFQCISTVDNGDHLQWIKVGSQLQGTLSIVTGGLELSIHTPVVGSAGIYICRDTLRNEEVQFELTDSSPAARAANSSLVYYVGDTAVIEMYASAVTPFVEGSLIWKKNNEALNEGILSSDNKTLTIPNVQLSNAGLYKLTAVVAAGIFTTSATSNTTLQVLEPPFITDHPSDQMNQEWESVQFTCTAKHSLSLSISWHKVNGVLPSSSTITNDDSSNLTNTTSTLSITELRTNDSGIYYCTVSDGSRSISSNNATLTVTDNTRLTYTSQVLSDPFLFLSEPGVIDCEGSGNHYWSGPSMTSIPSSLVGDSTIYQYTIPDTGFTQLNLTSLEAFPDGLYTCLSTVNRSIYLTNDNPSIYSERHEVVVGSISNTVLRVYVNGIDPTPSANDIEWFYNDAPLPINNDYYGLQDDNKQLVISNVSSELIVGRYHINVTTTQGTQSVYIDISYFDPPVVNVSPDVSEYIVDVGETVIFNCTVSSDTPVSTNWYKSDGVLLDSNDGSLILSNISDSDANDYYCEAVDAEGIYAIKRTITLIIQHAPVVTVETIHSGPQPSLSDAFEEGRSNSPTYYCSVSAVPSPTTVQWLFNGNTSLPMGVQQSEEISDSNNDIKYKLHWTRPVLYIDNGTFSCHALNSIGESVANVHITVYAIPQITTVYSTDLPTSIDSSIVSFTNLSSSTDDSSITCIGYGLPYPSIHWVNSDGHELTNAYTFNKCGLYGTVVSSLRLTQVMTQEPVYCRVMNEIGNETQAVSIAQDTNGNESSLMPTINTVTSNIVNIRLKLNMKMCIVNLESVEISLRSVLELIIQRGTHMCDPLLKISLLFNDDGCDSALILVVSIETDTTNNANNALQAISQWINTNPAIIIEGQPHQLDSNCSLIVSTQQLTSPSDDSSLFLCTPEQPTSQATPTPSTPPTSDSTTNTPQSGNSQMVIWLSIVGVILLLLLIVVASLVIVLYLCAKTISRSGKGVLVGGVKPAWSDQENISMNTYRNTSMQELQTSSPFRNQLQQSSSQDSNNGVRVGVMQDNPEYLIGPQLELLQSMTDDQIDSGGPPNYQWVTDNNNNIARDSGYIETMRSSAVMMSQETIRSTTPFQEKLYQYGGGNEENNEDPTYAVIRPEARKHSTDQITTSMHNSNTDVHTRRNQIMPEATRRATLPSNMRYSPMRRPHQYGGPKSPAHYTKPHPQHLATATTPPGGQRSVTNSSPAVNRPMPYSLPVSSTGSLRNVGLHSRPPRSGVTRPIVNRSLSTPNTIKEEPVVSSAGNSPLRTVNEINNGGQQWYDGEDNSDIVTPTTPIDNYDEVDSISPYAVTPSSQIEVHPSSQPTVGSDWQLSTVTGGSSPSTIRPNQLPVVSQPFVEYQTIDV